MLSVLLDIFASVSFMTTNVLIMTSVVYYFKQKCENKNPKPNPGSGPGLRYVWFV